jgi:hypothetical protein
MSPATALSGRESASPSFVPDLVLDDVDMATSQGATVTIGVSRQTEDGDALGAEGSAFEDETAGRVHRGLGGWHATSLVVLSLAGGALGLGTAASAAACRTPNPRLPRRSVADPVRIRADLDVVDHGVPVGQHLERPE